MVTALWSVKSLLKVQVGCRLTYSACSQFSDDYAVAFFINFIARLVILFWKKRAGIRSSLFSALCNRNSN